MDLSFSIPKGNSEDKVDNDTNNILENNEINIKVDNENKNNDLNSDLNNDLNNENSKNDLKIKYPEYIKFVEWMSYIEKKSDYISIYNCFFPIALIIKLITISKGSFNNEVLNEYIKLNNKDSENFNSIGGYWVWLFNKK